MSFFAIVFALLLEQVRPLGHDNPVHAGVRAWIRWVSRNVDAGTPVHGWLAWTLAVGVPGGASLAIYWALQAWVGWPFAVLWSAALLYVTLGFRQFSHHFTDIRDALAAGDEALAREHLARWQRVDAHELPRSEIVRHVIEYSVLAAHRHVFGVLAWFSILAALGFGPAGAVLYRVGEFVARYWHHPVASRPMVSPPLRQAASQAWFVMDWLPARITALGFAVVGSFEEAVDSWRNQVQRHPEDNDGVILAATSGAINVRLGGQPLKPVAPAAVPEIPLAEDAQLVTGLDQPLPGRDPESAHLVQVVGLVWRSVVMWLVLLALLTFARLLG
ncbi:MAG: CobD/CbiB family protein [Burkholderiaceae bacterium]|nr:CobD/CbiB family protein [Burkholderiaceae bacterium]